MKRFVEGIARQQATLFPECLEDWIDCDNPVRVIDGFVENSSYCAWDLTGRRRRRLGDLRIIQRGC